MRYVPNDTIPPAPQPKVLQQIFYTGSFSGLTSFPDASEYFNIKRDSRVAVLSFTYRFGKSYKVSSHNSSATEEEERIHNN